MMTSNSQCRQCFLHTTDQTPSHCQMRLLGTEIQGKRSHIYEVRMENEAGRGEGEGRGRREEGEKEERRTEGGGRWSRRFTVTKEEVGCKEEHQ